MPKQPPEKYCFAQQYDGDCQLIPFLQILKKNKKSEEKMSQLIWSLRGYGIQNVNGYLKFFSGKEHGSA